MTRYRYLSDEEILYEAYHKFALTKRSKAKEVDASSDSAVVASMVARSSLAITQLTSDQSIVNVQKNVLNAKKMHTQYLIIKNRRPACISSSLKQNMELLVREVCKCEADMIQDLRLQEVDGEGIDVEKIFQERKYLKRLGSVLARDIVRSAIYSADASKYVRNLFITAHGKKFHRADCPFCKSDRLIPASRDLIETRELTPCKCLGTADLDGKLGCVTVFIDESISPVEWDETGKAGMVGKFSYIICRGRVYKESEIKEENVITQGVEYSSEHEHIDRLSKAAIERVLIILAYDYEFVGRVNIFTDSQSIIGNWEKSSKNGKLARLFAKVTVSYIPRQENRRADRLCRERMILNIPTKRYKDVVDKCARVEELEAKVKELEILIAEQKEVKYGWWNYITRITGRFFKNEIPVKNT